MKKISLILLLFGFLISCQGPQKKEEASKLKILIDTDANNELDDEHALAYAFLNESVFDIVGITVNNTRNGYGIQGQYDEALRIIQLFNLEGQIPLFIGADKNYEEIAPQLIERVDFVYEPGQFAIRGGIVDIFSFGNEWPYRIELFDEEIESIRTFNPTNQLSLKNIERVSIIPNINSGFKQNENVP